MLCVKRPLAQSRRGPCRSRATAPDQHTAAAAIAAAGITAIAAVIQRLHIWAAHVQMPWRANLFSNAVVYTPVCRSVLASLWWGRGLMVVLVS